MFAEQVVTEFLSSEDDGMGFLLHNVPASFCVSEPVTCKGNNMFSILVVTLNFEAFSFALVTGICFKNEEIAAVRGT